MIINNNNNLNKRDFSHLSTPKNLALVGLYAGFNPYTAWYWLLLLLPESWH